MYLTAKHVDTQLETLLEDLTHGEDPSTVARIVKKLRTMDTQFLLSEEVVIFQGTRIMDGSKFFIDGWAGVIITVDTLLKVVRIVMPKQVSEKALKKMCRNIKECRVHERTLNDINWELCWHHIVGGTLKKWLSDLTTEKLKHDKQAAGLLRICRGAPALRPKLVVLRFVIN